MQGVLAQPETGLLLLGVLVLGAVGLFLAMPGGRLTVGRVGLVILAAGAASLVALLLNVFGGSSPLPTLAGCVVVALFAAVRVITHKKPVYSALYFVLLVLAVGATLLLMDAEFLAAALLIVYAGAILVTYVFVIMLAQQAKPAPYDTKAREPFTGCLAGFVLLTILTLRFLGTPTTPAQLPAPIGDAAGTVENVGTPLLTYYIVAIQIAGVLLLAAMVGAIAIARRKVTDPPVQLPEGGAD